MDHPLNKITRVLYFEYFIYILDYLLYIFKFSTNAKFVILLGLKSAFELSNKKPRFLRLFPDSKEAVVATLRYVIFNFPLIDIVPT